MATDTFTDSTKEWATNEHAGKKLFVLPGEAGEQEVTISSNTSDTLTVTPDLDPEPSTDDDYEIRHYYESTEYGIRAAPGKDVTWSGDFVVEGGGIVATGDQGPVTIPSGTVGGGYRFMWVASKAALRAGIASSDFWDEENIGVGSISFGWANKSSGPHSATWNYSNTASGDRATAFGYSTTSSGNQATAFGYSTTSSGDQAAAFGYSTTASGDRATAFGYSTTASGDQATAWGDRTVAETGSAATAWGSLTEASGNQATAFGDSTTASGAAATAFGSLSDASGNHSLACGYDTTASGGVSVAFGHTTTASGLNGTTAMGRLMTVSGETSVGINLYGDTTARTVTADNVFVVMGGKVGLGTLAPAEVLDVTGNFKLSGTSALGGTVSIGGGYSSGSGITAASNGGLSITGNFNVDGHIAGASTSVIYFGDGDTNGSWRILRDGTDLVFERRESGSWVTKDTISA